MMDQESIWMNPESFAEQFIVNPKLLNGVIRIEYGDTDKLGNDIAIRVMQQDQITLEELKSVRPVWTNSNVRGVARLSEYVVALQSSQVGRNFVQHPLIDKKHGLIFDIDSAHEALAEFLFTAYEGHSSAPIGERGVQYILKGYGYYLSSIGNGYFYVGKVLFDRNALDENDAFILENRIAVIEDVSDFQNYKRRVRW